MMKSSLIIAVLLFLSLQSAALPVYSQVIINNKTYVRYDFMLKTIHLGDNLNKAWADPSPKRDFSAGFSIGGGVEEAQLFMDVFQVDNNCNSIKINGVKVGIVCKYSPASWSGCSIEIPASTLHEGENNLRIESCSIDSFNLDDFQLSNIHLLLKYREFNPSILPTKILSNYSLVPGQQVNVTVILANIGVKNAHNITAVDFIPRGAVLLEGNRTYSIDLLKGGEAVWYQYTLLLERVGDFNSTEGVVAYQDDKEGNYSTTIEATSYSVRNPSPTIGAQKKFSQASLMVGDKSEVNITLYNDGEYDAFNVAVEDYLTDAVKILNGSITQSYAHLPGNSTVSFSYSFQAAKPVELSSKAVVRYSDIYGRTYESDSNYAALSIKEKAETKKLVDADTLIKALVVVALAIAVLYFIYMRFA